MTREIVILADETTCSLSADRRNIGPWGACGGQPGGTSDCIVVSADGESKQLPSKITTKLKKGDRIAIVTPGGGGWANPLERDPGAVSRDVNRQYIALERAREQYGVVVDPENACVDETATREERTSRRNKGRSAASKTRNPS